jgi:5-formyltetrahydrofolate cyclo-ligase
MDDPDLERAKAEARRRARASRLKADPRAGLAAMENFPLEIAHVTPVGGYWPVGAEMDPRPLMAAFAKAGRQVALPRLATRDGPARFLLWRDGQPLAPDAFGVPSPLSSSGEVAPSLLLVPLLAFDRGGRRLGQGAGIYDRILAAMKPSGVLAVGLAHATQEMDVVPAGPLDASLDWVVTDREAIRCG